MMYDALDGWHQEFRFGNQGYGTLYGFVITSAPVALIKVLSGK